MPQPQITKICLKITYLKFHSNFPGVSDYNTLLAYFTNMKYIAVNSHDIFKTIYLKYDDNDDYSDDVDISDEITIVMINYIAILIVIIVTIVI